MNRKEEIQSTDLKPQRDKLAEKLPFLLRVSYKGARFFTQEQWIRGLRPLPPIQRGFIEIIISFDEETRLRFARRLLSDEDWEITLGKGGKGIANTMAFHSLLDDPTTENVKTALKKLPPPSDREQEILRRNFGLGIFRGFQEALSQQTENLPPS